MRIASLPYVDEQAAVIPADTGDVWRGLVGTLDRIAARPGTARYARLVRAADQVAGGPRPLAVTSTLPGFRVVVAEPGRELALVGRHFFSTYALVLRLSPLAPTSARGPAHTLLHGETRAVFPGPLGAVYRAAVIDTGAHAIGMRRLLGSVRRAVAE